MLKQGAELVLQHCNTVLCGFPWLADWLAWVIYGVFLQFSKLVFHSGGSRVPLWLLTFPPSSYSFRFKDTYGRTVSLPYSIWYRAPRWYERGADQPWSGLCWSAQHFPSDECGSCGGSGGGSLRAISSGKCLLFVHLVLRAVYIKYKACGVNSSSLTLWFGEYVMENMN